MSTTINQRIKEIADKLCDGNISEMARITGVKQPTLRDVAAGKQVQPGFDMLRKIVDSPTLNISSEWLLKGKGAMQNNRKNILQGKVNKIAHSRAIPVYNVHAAGNLQTLFADSRPYYIGEIEIPSLPPCDGAIYVQAENMRPLINGGDMVAYKQLRSIKNLLPGEMYLIQYLLGSDDFQMINYVEWEERNETLRLASYDKHYDDMIIPVSAVQAMARVMMVLNIRSIS